MRRRQALSNNPEQWSRVSRAYRTSPPGANTGNAGKAAEAVASAGPALAFEAMSDRVLAECFEAQFGSRPHHRMKRETILARLHDPD